MPKVVNMNMFVQCGKPFPPKLNKRKDVIVSSETLIGYSKYTGRKMTEDLSKSDVSLAPGGYFEYSTKRRGATRTYTNEGWKDDKQSIETFRNYVASNFQNEGDLAWIPVQSYKDYATSSQYGLFKDEDYASVTEAVLKQFFKRVGFDEDNMIWWMNYHTNKSHPHVHLVFLEKEKTRTRGMFSEKETSIFKGLIYKEMAKRERELSKTNGVLKDMFTNINDTKTSLKSKAHDLIANSKNDKIELLIKNLYIKLPESGRLQYGSSHMIPFRESIDEIVDVILSHPDVEHYYQSLLAKWNQMDSETSMALHEEIHKVRDSEVSKLRKQIANDILNNFKGRSFTVHNNLEEELSFSSNNQSALNRNEHVDDIHQLVLDDEFLDVLGESDHIMFEEKSKDKVTESDVFLGYKVEWNDLFKEGMQHLYGDEINKPNLFKAIDCFEEDILSGNVLSLVELGKILGTQEQAEEQAEERSEKLLREAITGFEAILNDSSKEKQHSYINYRLGKHYMYGQGTEQNYTSAMDYFMQAGNNKYALYSLGTMFERGMGWDEDVEVACEYFTQSADLGNPYASYKMGQYLEKDDHETSSSYYEQAFRSFSEMLKKNNNENLLYKVGLMRLEGKGCEVDIEEGLANLKKSADFGNQNAKYQYIKFTVINGMEDDITDEYINELVNDKHRLTLRFMGLQLAKSDDVNDRIKAIEFLEEIEDSHMDASVMYSLAGLYEKTGETIKQVDALRHAAELDHLFANLKLGQVLGNDTTEGYLSYKKALVLLLDAPAVEETFKNNRIGYLYEKGYGMPEQNIAKSLHYYKQAILQGDSRNLVSYARVAVSNKQYDTFDYLVENLKRDTNPYSKYWLGRLYLDSGTKYYNYRYGMKLLGECYQETGHDHIKELIDHNRAWEKEMRHNAHRASGGSVASAINALKRMQDEVDSRVEHEQDIYYQTKQQEGKML